MSVSIEDIKALRDKTGVSMSSCKSALEEANGDLNAAIEILRKKGEAKAADRADRSTAEGAIVIESETSKAALVQLLCETDFVARSDEFRAVASDLAKKLLAGTLEAGAQDLQEVKDAGLQMGESVRLGETLMVTAPVVGTYVHSNAKIGVIVSMEGVSEEVAKDVAMHVAASNPECISPDEVPNELVEREKGIWAEQLAQEGKPAELVEKIMMGKEKKFREENALLKQQFVKNPDLTVESFIASGKVLSFTRVAI